MVRRLVVADTHVAVTVDHALVEEHAIGGDQIVDQLRIGGARGGGSGLNARAAQPGEGGEHSGAAGQHVPATRVFHAHPSLSVSLPQGAAEQAPDQITLQHDHQYHGRHAGQHRGGGDVAPRYLEDAREEGEGHRHRAARLRRRESVGEEELVPRKEKGEEGSRGEPRREEGENDPAEGAGRLAPSTAAASSSWAGTSWRKPVRSQITSGRANEVLARMSASHVSRSPSARRRRKSGLTVAIWGKAVPATMKRRSSPLPGTG